MSGRIRRGGLRTCRQSYTKARALTLALLPLALTPKNNEIGRALKARIMEVEEELTAARNTTRPMRRRVCPLRGRLSEGRANSTVTSTEIAETNNYSQAEVR